MNHIVYKRGDIKYALDKAQLSIGLDKQKILSVKFLIFSKPSVLTYCGTVLLSTHNIYVLDEK